MKALLVLASLALPAASSSVKFENLVTFGDSYTDEGRLAYFLENNGQTPPAGTLLPENNETSSGGYAWPRIVAQKTGAKSFNYAVGGATCSKDIVEATFALTDQSLPAVLEEQIAAYKADLEIEELYGNRTADNTVYALWIGTNDLGAGGFLIDANVEGTTIPSFVDCAWEVFDIVYQSGGRQFILLNTVPLEHSPLYNIPDAGGTLDSYLWANKTAYNMTDYKYKIMEYTSSANTMFEYGAPFQHIIKGRWPNATVSVFDVHSLMMDIIDSPAEYLASPTNATGFYHHCSLDMTQCEDSEEQRDSFMWFDELHPSEQTNEIIADRFIEVAAGFSKYGKIYVFQ